MWFHVSHVTIPIADWTKGLMLRATNSIVPKTTLILKNDKSFLSPCISFSLSKRHDTYPFALALILQQPWAFCPLRVDGRLNPPCRQQFLPNAHRCLCPNPQQLQRPSVYEVLHVGDEFYMCKTRILSQPSIARKGAFFFFLRLSRQLVDRPSFVVFTLRMGNQVVFALKPF
jgi:hypothetical protein